jgi:protein O-mannosyl-transferase
LGKQTPKTKTPLLPSLPTCPRPPASNRMRRKPIKNRPPTREAPLAASTRPCDRPRSILVPLAVCVFLLAAVFVVFYQTTGFDFVNYDDADYVYRNAIVTKGLTWEGVRWAFTERRACANWHPLTWLSHEIDCSLYGPHQPVIGDRDKPPDSLFAGGHHLTSVLLHAAAAILLFLVLWRMTDGLWPSAFVAAVFAVHPLRVESVAWIAERKDVLSGLFFMLTLAAYVGYVRRPFSLTRYLGVIVLFALGLMAKPMLVTLPFVLLLLDYWPLGRMSASGWRGSCTATPGAVVQLPLQRNLPRRQFPWHLVVEKVPLFVLTATSCVVTTLAQGKAVMPVDVMPWFVRTANAVVAYVAYLRDSFFPVGLAAYYPHPGVNLPLWKTIAASLVLVGVSAAVVLGRRKRPYLFVGWFWYVGMLVPVIGLVQVGGQAMADRYTYLPQIGLGIAVAWGAAELTRTWPHRQWACGVASALIVTVMMGCTWQQTAYWRDSITLWTRTLECTERNVMAHHDYGVALMRLKQYERAAEQFEEALLIQPNHTEAHYNLGVTLSALHHPEAAVEHFRAALEFRAEESEKVWTEGHYGLAAALAKAGRPDAAIAEFRRVLDAEPDNANAQYNLGVILYERGKRREALSACRKAIAIQPDDVVSMEQVAWILATCPEASLRNGREAVVLAERAVELSDGNTASVYSTLAAAYGEAGQFREAVRAAQRAVALALEQDDKESAAIFGIQMKFYQAETPYHERDERPR